MFVVRSRGGKCIESFLFCFAILCLAETAFLQPSIIIMIPTNSHVALLNRSLRIFGMPYTLPTPKPQVCD